MNTSIITYLVHFSSSSIFILFLGTTIFKNFAVLLLNYTESVLAKLPSSLMALCFWTMIRMKRGHFGFSASFIRCTNTFAQYLTKLELWRIRVQTQNNNHDVFWFIPEPIVHIGCLSSSNSYECTQ